jgi:hypothetical protein
MANRLLRNDARLLVVECRSVQIDLCVFERLAIDAKTASRSDATWMIINSLLHRLCRLDMAAIVLKAFPLEYEGNATKENRSAFGATVACSCSALSEAAGV